MAPKIESGQLCTVAPVDPADVRVGDIVLCKVNGTEYLHLVKAIQSSRFPIGNNTGRINGRVPPRARAGNTVNSVQFTTSARARARTTPSPLPAADRHLGRPAFINLARH
jgi:hypothetical protein